MCFINFCCQVRAVCVVCVVQQLSESLDEFGEKWELNPADGAFYGPKVCLMLVLLLCRLNCTNFSLLVRMLKIVLLFVVVGHSILSQAFASLLRALFSLPQ